MSPRKQLPTHPGLANLSQGPAPPDRICTCSRVLRPDTARTHPLPTRPSTFETSKRTMSQSPDFSYWAPAKGRPLCGVCLPGEGKALWDRTTGLLRVNSSDEALRTRELPPFLAPSAIGFDSFLRRKQFEERIRFYSAEPPSHWTSLSPSIQR